MATDRGRPRSPERHSSTMRTCCTASRASYRRRRASQARPPLRPAAPHALHSFLAMSPQTTDRVPVRIGVLLAGGESRRMGRDKRGLRLGGETLLQRNLAFLGDLFPVLGLSVRSAEQAPDDLPAGVVVIPDEVPGSPLAGLASILGRFDEPVFAMAADLIAPEPGAVARVLAGVPRRGRRPPGRRGPPGAAARRLRPRLPAAHAGAARGRRAQHPRPLPSRARRPRAVRRHGAVLQREHAGRLGRGAAPARRRRASRPRTTGRRGAPEVRSSSGSSAGPTAARRRSSRS